jgi:hypothetical protein
MAISSTVLSALTQMADKTFANGLAKLVRDPLCAGKVRQAAIARNPAAGYIPIDGDTSLDGDVLTVNNGIYSGALINAQALASEEETLHRPLIIFVEGRGFNGTTAAADNLRKLNCPQVGGAVIVQDRTVAQADPLFANYAAAETVLGLASRRAVNESIAWVADGNIQDRLQGIFTVPGISSGSALSDYTAGDLATLNGKGYIIPVVYTDYEGVYVFDSPTCIVDSDDYATVELNRTIQKAIRIAYKTLVPDINRAIPVDTQTGRMTPSICKYFEAKVDTALDIMLQNQECSAVSSYVDPNQNVISTGKVYVHVTITPTGTAREINVFIGFNNPFNQQ